MGCGTIRGWTGRGNKGWTVNKRLKRQKKRKHTQWDIAIVIKVTVLQKMSFNKKLFFLETLNLTFAELIIIYNCNINKIRKYSSVKLWALLNIFDTFCNYFPNQHKFIQVYNVINVLCSPWLFCMLSMKWGNINQQDWISKVWESRLIKAHKLWIMYVWMYLLSIILYVYRRYMESI